MTLKLSLAVKTVVVFQNCGCVTSTTIAVTIRMNQLTCVVREIAQLAGRDVPASRIIVASQNGCSAMERTIVETTAMSFQKTVPLVKQKLTSSVRTTVAFQNNGLVTLLMIAVTALMKPKRFAKENIAIAPNQSLDATMENVFRADGDAVS